MVIIAGNLHVAPEVRDVWIEAHRDVVERARSAPGCIDLHISADLVDKGRVNLFEQWESEDALEAWREVADPPPRPQILAGSVQKYLVSSSGPPF